MLPAPGYRDAGNNKRFGGLGSVGLEGSVWSTGTSGGYGIYLFFQIGALSSYSHARAHGFQLRCLSE